MKIYKVELLKATTQIILMPEKHKIMNIQMQNGNPVLYALVDPESQKKEVKINMYGTGWETHDNVLIDKYLGTVQDGRFVWHFFINPKF